MHRRHGRRHTRPRRRSSCSTWRRSRSRCSTRAPPRRCGARADELRALAADPGATRELLGVAAYIAGHAQRAGARDPRARAALPRRRPAPAAHAERPAVVPAGDGRADLRRRATATPRPRSTPPWRRRARSGDGVLFAVSSRSGRGCCCGAGAALRGGARRARGARDARPAGAAALPGAGLRGPRRQPAGAGLPAARGRGDRAVRVARKAGHADLRGAAVRARPAAGGAGEAARGPARTCSRSAAWRPGRRRRRPACCRGGRRRRARTWRWGSVRRRRGWREEELALARALGAPRALGIALRTAGLAAEGGAGGELLAEAVALHEQADAAIELVHSQLEHGAWLRRANKRAEARELLRAALDGATRGGAQAARRARAEVELRATGAKPRRVVLSGVDALTASERRIATLAAEGMTNREIAQALYVTARTVEGHLTSVFRKLDVDSRDQLPALMEGQARGLIPHRADHALAAAVEAAHHGADRDAERVRGLLVGAAGDVDRDDHVAVGPRGAPRRRRAPRAPRAPRRSGRERGGPPPSSRRAQPSSRGGSRRGSGRRGCCAWRGRGSGTRRPPPGGGSAGRARACPGRGPRRPRGSRSCAWRRGSAGGDGAQAAPGRVRRWASARDRAAVGRAVWLMGAQSAGPPRPFAPGTPPGLFRRSRCTSEPGGSVSRHPEGRPSPAQRVPGDRRRRTLAAGDAGRSAQPACD